MRLDLLQDADLTRLRRLLDRTLGHGFKLVIIEVHSQNQRQRVEELLRSLYESPLQLESVAFTDVAANVWDGLLARLKTHAAHDRTRLVLSLWGIEDNASAPGVLHSRLRQLNVQRDIFVRDLGVVWVLFVYPGTTKALMLQAPDFADFAALWITALPEGTSEITSPISLSEHAMKRWVALAAYLLEQSGLELSPKLRLSLEALRHGRFDQARDAFHSARVEDHPAAPAQPLVEALWMAAVGQWREAERAVSQTLRETALPQPLPGLAHFVRGLVRLDIEDFPGAIEDLEKCRSEATQSAPAVARLSGIVLGHAYLQLGRLKEARSELEASLASASSDNPDSLNVPWIASAHYVLATALRSQGYLAEAREQIERCLALSRSMLGAEPDRSIAAALHELGLILSAQGDLAGARESLEHSLAISRLVYDSDQNPDTSATLYELGGVLHSKGDLVAARECLERSLEIDVLLYATDQHPIVASTLFAIGRVLQEEGNLAGAREYLERSLRITVAHSGTHNHPAISAILRALGSVLQEQGDLVGARENLERSLEIVLAFYDTQNHREVAAALHALGRLLKAQGDLAAAREHIERSLAIQLSLHGTDNHPDIAATLNNLAIVLREEGNIPEAIEVQKRSVSAAKTLFGTAPNLKVAWAQAALGMMYLDVDRREEALALFRQASPVLAELDPLHPCARMMGSSLDNEEPKSEGHDSEGRDSGGRAVHTVSPLTDPLRLCAAGRM